MSPLERFEAKYEVDSGSGCWLWTACADKNSYGRFWDGSKAVFAHRWSYEHHVREIPNDLVIDHLCRTPCCVNPAHLEPVTLLENLRRGDNTHRSWRKHITHCPQGHEYNEENIYRNNGKRRCRTCRRQNVPKYNAARKIKKALG